MPDWLSPAYWSRPGRSVKKQKDVDLSRPKPNVGEAFRKAGQGFSKLRELTNKSRSPSKR
jgi:hypothetical protein